MQTGIVEHLSVEPDGTPVARHLRQYLPDGRKHVWWEGLDGTLGLGGRPLSSLPLDGASLVASWPLDEPVFLVEGETAAVALRQAGLHAVGTVTGAGGCPDRSVLIVLKDRDARLWPDADGPGETHMAAVAAAMRGIVRSIHIVRWAEAGIGEDGADFLVGHGAADVLGLALSLPQRPARQHQYPPRSRRYPTPAARYPTRRGRGQIQRFNDDNTVSDVLIREFGLERAKPVRSVRCPGSAHRNGDRSPSLFIHRDNRRAYCHLPGCVFNGEGHGVDAFDIDRIAKGGLQ